MKKILFVLIFGIMMVFFTGCGQTKQEESLQDVYKMIEAYFKDDNVDLSNFGGYSKDEKMNQIIVALVDNSREKQEEFLKEAKVNSKYIKFIQGGPYDIAKIDVCIEDAGDYNGEFNHYYKSGDRTIYLASNIKEFYIISGSIWSLNDYIPSINQSFDATIEEITNELDQKEILRDGGTVIYKGKEKNITMVVCHTLDNNEDIFIGDYSMNYDYETMCK